jgi:hypothetical protein
LIGFLYNSSNNNINIHLQHQANHNNYKHLFNQFNNNKLVVGGNQQPQQQQWVPQVSTHLHATLVLLFVNVTNNHHQTKVLFVINFLYIMDHDRGMWFYANLYITSIMCDNFLYRGFVVITTSIVIKHVW